MLKHTFINFAIILIVTLCCEGTIVRIPNYQNQFTDDRVVSYESEPHLPWQAHVMDFINLINMEKILSTTVKYIDNPEVMRFIGFLFSPTFKDMVWELESIEEFKEAYIFLASKGYDVKDVIDYVNKVLHLPQFDKPQEILRSNEGVSEFIAAIIGTIPLQDMKDLLKRKMENYPDVAEFIEVIKSPEFMDIMERILTSHKFSEFKSTFESYGVDFNFICEIINEVIGVEYENVICKHK